MARWAVPILALLVAVNNTIVGIYATDYSAWSANLATFAFVAVNLPLFHPRIQWLFMHPERRWWLRAERKRMPVPVTVNVRLVRVRAGSSVMLIVNTCSKGTPASLVVRTRML